MHYFAYRPRIGDSTDAMAERGSAFHMVHCLTWQAFAKVEAISASRSNAGPQLLKSLQG